MLDESLRAAAAILATIAAVWPPRPAPGRGWCRACGAPDLWLVFRPTSASLGFALAALAAYAGTLVLAILGIVWGAFGALAVEVVLVVRARRARRRVIRCNTCERTADQYRCRQRRSG